MVEVVGHNPAWPELFAGLEHDINGVLDDAQVEHIGSTSVPGLAAKPVLDVAIGLAPPIESETVVDALTSLGLAYFGDLGVYGGLLFTANAEVERVLAHVHVVDRNDFQWRWYLAFRDGLRADPELRQAYQQLKRTAARDHVDDRNGYNQAKFEWVLSTASRLGEAGPDR
jgi:GrpB-like predicted nucleotidyltransferase (UPF0157 family)